MHAATNRLEFAPPPTPGQLRALVLAVLAHVVLLAILSSGVQWKSEAVSITAEAELWSELPQQAAPRLQEVPAEPIAPAQPVPQEPSPTPIPAAIPPPQVAPDIALAREKLRLKQKALQKQQELAQQREREQQRLDQLQQEKLRREKSRNEEKLLEAKRLQDKLDLAKKTVDQKKKAELDRKQKDTQQALQESQKLAAMREENLKRMSGLAGASGTSGAAGTSLQSSGPSAGYGGRIRARIKPNIVFTDDIAGNPTAEVEVRAAADGTITSRKLVKSSGVNSWDEAVLKAIDKTEVLPRDTDGRVPQTLVISFRPKD
jgi:colicin import membrane protein